MVSVEILLYFIHSHSGANAFSHPLSFHPPSLLGLGIGLQIEMLLNTNHNRNPNLGGGRGGAMKVQKSGPCPPSALAPCFTG